MYDPWIMLAAMAMRTQRVRLGAIVFAPARRRPWKLAREAVTLDVLSGGRLVLPVGLGTLDDAGFGNVGEPTPARDRAERLDETLAILDGLESGEPFGFEGEHYRFGPMTFLPRPIQRPRIPVWVVGAWPHERSMRRAARWDGIFVQAQGPDGGPATGAEVLPPIVDWLRRERPPELRDRPFDIVVDGVTPAGDLRRAAAIADRPRGGGRDLVDRVRLVRGDRRRAPGTDRGRPAKGLRESAARGRAPLPSPKRPRDDEPGHDRQPVRRAPDAQGVDHEQLQEQEVALEDHADERQAVDRVEQPGVRGPDPGQRQPERDQREHDAVDRDRDAGDPRVLALGDRVAAVERAAVGHAPAELDRSEVAGDREAQQVEGDEDPAGVDAAEAIDGRHRIGPEHSPRDSMAPDARRRSVRRDDEGADHAVRLVAGQVADVGQRARAS